ncbi:predicted signal transduction protein containing a membrane domain, an EAL and a GGDEF domain [Hahella chejuensis KCTC 2396]|uniref:Predicted signal transduction protein containing a membrane domain, an EAL and a GGDEF domain n=1 Tax=Hahella chejuensis (strain KCTC 2396) TaxID=349521 RepID=Q2SM38_HAHCH|nr:EAL domain-containing protein [Hahella chejuensis]ABC28286.1 predicted signal transduction protein containing a membrane domain, an EAL and a GGDEF domain [Hahella chejuensis KCTC 2396]
MNSLRNQILLLSVSLVCVASLTILGAYWISIGHYTSDRINQDFSSAAKVFGQLIESREVQLTTTAEVLTSDFGFKQAVATQDTQTIQSVLNNHSERISADLMLLLDLSGALQASTQDSPSPIAKFAHQDLLRQALTHSGAAEFVAYQGELYQMIILPVYAPAPIGFAAIGFRLDSELAEELRQITNVHISFVWRDQGAAKVVSTLPRDKLNEALRAPETIPDTLLSLIQQKQTFSSKRRPLSGMGDSAIEAVLTVPLHNAFAEFAILRDRILLISALTFLLSIVGSMVLSHNLTKPLGRMVKIASDLSRGQYRNLTPISIATSEIKTLFQAFIKMGSDIEEREYKITYQATHDGLTGLFNRNKVIAEVEDALRRHNAPFLIISLNINGFKNINDTFGPKVGDDCLRAVGQRLVEFIPKNPVCARLGADEFLCLVDVFGNESARTICDKLLAHLARPFKVDDLRLTLSFSIGVAQYPEHAAAAEELLRRASIALDKARSERCALRFYESGEDEAHLRRLQLLQDLKLAIAEDDGQLCMYYQPKMHLASGRVDKCEALIRWSHPEQGFIPPDIFVELAEQAGLIASLTDWVTHTVINQVAEWRDQGIDLQAAINLSAQDLERDELLDNVLNQLETLKLPTRAISFELTERDMMSDADHAIALMQRFRQRGFTLSVDDYGIGYSSLSKLKQMPVSEIKIDKSFVIPLEQSASDKIIVRSTIELGHSFNLKVIAEGVESQRSMDLLAEMGCDYIQGYFLSKPMPAKELASWLRQRAQQLPSQAFGKV